MPMRRSWQTLFKTDELSGRKASRRADLLSGAHQIGDRLRFHFIHNPAAVDLDGLLAGSELIGDLLVQQAANHQRHHLAFPRGQHRVTLCNRIPLRSGDALQAAATRAGVQGFLDGRGRHGRFDD